jgi:hypothetical protein
VRLAGVHMLCFRQSLRRLSQPLGSGCFAHLVDVQSDSDLLNAFLEERLPLSSHIVAYDTSGNSRAHRAFRRPQHVLIVCESGHIDAICEDVSICD